MPYPALKPELRVLLIEDNATDALVVCDELVHAAGVRFVVNQVQRIAQARALLAASPAFDVILLDLSLPDSDGLASFSQIQAAAKAASIVVLSHSRDEALALQAVRAGAQDYLVKGQAEGQLVRAIRYAVGRAQADQALRASEARWAFALEGAGDGVWDWDLVANTAFFSRRWKEMLGYTEAEIGTQPDEWMKRIHPDDLPAMRKNLQRHLDGGSAAYHFEHRLMRKDGSYLGTLTRGMVVTRDLEGKPVRIVGTQTDLSAQRKSEEQLHILQASLENINDIVIISKADPKGLESPRIVYVNNAFERRTGYSRAEALGKTPRILQGPNTQRLEMDRITEAVRQGQPVRAELINYTKTGEEFWLESEIVPLKHADGHITHWVVVARDTSERKKADLALMQSEQRNQLALKGGNLGFWDWNVAADTLYASPRWYAMLGLNPATDLASLALWHSLVHPDDMPKLDALVHTVILSPTGIEFEAEIRARHSNGQYIWILVKGAVVERNAACEPLRVIGTHLDITVQKEAAIASLNSQKVLQEYQLQLQDLTRRILNAQETERRRVAHELHDELGQSLTAIKINLLTQQRINKAPPSALDVENVRIVEDALQQVRRLALALRPSMLDDLGLPAALAWLADTASVNRDTAVNFSYTMQEERLTPEIETACFRIVQETLTNIRRHARAKKVDINLVCDENQLILTVTDDGAGFDPAPKSGRVNPRFSLGLVGIRERAMSIGGAVTIRSAPGQGCTVQLTCNVANQLPPVS